MSVSAVGRTLDVTSLNVSLAGHEVLTDVALSLPARTTTAVVGPSGSGKTTLLRSIAGFLQPSSGEILLDGSAITKQPVHRRPIGLVSQDGALFPHMSVERNVAFGLDSSALSRSQRRAKVGELLDLVSLPQSYGERRPDELSGGQRQRVALARALARAPQVILLDEPFSALDAGLRERTRKAVQKVLRATGTTALLVTHDQDEALSFADQVAVLTEGRIRQAGAPQDVYASPSDLETAQFLGEAVVLDAVISDGWASCVLGEIPLRFPAAAGPARVMLRPEQLTLAPAGRGVLGVVLDSDYFGHDTTVTVRVHGQDEVLRVRQLNTPPPAPGETIGLDVEGPGMAYAVASAQ
ncbi:ABC transporter ATP-binding protein [Nesterenkonia sp. NBAIMH1]|uniref:ABC transporter ATP-binding protein n=1 Tax=Nesterenkonia sp. NBAIMH1 TaxID=2600320 RepID=UPI0011B7AC72|nr:ABC transporter ATP-binding protein [Nesterenkonia sp. NBAIMH1]